MALWLVQDLVSSGSLELVWSRSVDLLLLQALNEIG